MHPTTIESRQSECLSDFEVFIEKKRLRYQTIESRQSECLSGFVLVVVLIEKTFYVCSEKRANGKQGHFAPCFVGKRLAAVSISYGYSPSFSAFVSCILKQKTQTVEGCQVKHNL